MSLVTAASSPFDTTETPPRDLDRQLCDAALATYQSLAPAAWQGQCPFPGGRIVFPDPVLSRRYMLAGRHALEVNRDPQGALPLIDASIRLDYAGTLEASDCLVLRAEACHALGEDRPARAILLYNLGVTFGRRAAWREAGAAYRAAADLDPLFAWHLNNFAWMAATATDPAAHAGSLAVTLAQHTCVSTGFGCWAFLGTLAASYARVGDFARAVAWQRVARTLTPPAERALSEHKLAVFEAGQPFVDRTPHPVGGEGGDEHDGLDLDALRREAEALVGVRPASLH